MQQRGERQRERGSRSGIREGEGGREKEQKGGGEGERAERWREGGRGRGKGGRGGSREVERRREGGEIRKLQLNGKFHCEALIVAPCDELTQGQIRDLFAIFITATNPPCK